MKRKGMVGFTCVLLSLALLLTGCGKKSAEGSTTAPAKAAKEVAKSDEKITLSVWSWDVALMYLKDAAVEFQKKYPNVEFEFEEMGTDQVYNKLSTSLATGQGIADVIQLEGEVLAGYAEKFPKGFLDMSTAFKESEFLPVKVGEVKIGEKMHAFPWDAGPMGLFYRKDYFATAGVNAADLKTWDDFIAAGKKVVAVCKTATGESVKMVPIRPTKPSLYATFRSENGISTFDEKGNPLINDPRSIEAMELLKRMYDENIGQNFNGWDEYEGTVVNENVATIPEAVWMMGTIKDKNPSGKGKWGVVPLPQMREGENGGAANGGSVLAVNAKTKQKEMATAFVRFAMTDVKLQAEGFKKYGLYPSYIPCYDDPLFQEGDEFFGGDKIYNVFIASGKNIPAFPVNGNNAEANDMIGTAVSKILLNGEDIKTTLDKLQDEMIQKFRR